MINLSQEYKLSSKVLYYNFFKLGIIVIIAFIAFMFFSGSGEYATVRAIAMSPLAFVIIPIFALAVYLYWSFFRYTVFSDRISITSGILFTSQKIVNFNDLQNVEVKNGPVLAMFGLRNVVAFTSSPGQLVITSSRNGRTDTQQRPDVSITVEESIAKELSEIMHKGDVQKVQNVA